jgi:hypothetical protein
MRSLGWIPGMSPAVTAGMANSRWLELKAERSLGRLT